jgi:VanZ family protein
MAEGGLDMVRTGWQQTWVRILTTALTIFVMAMIFNLSTQTAERSDATSGFISNAVISVMYQNYPSETPERRQEIYDSVQHVVRKCAHFSEYTLLGFLIRLCLESWFGHRIRKRNGLMLPSFAVGTVYALTDELHQVLIEGRSGQWTDVLLDSCGVLFGAFLGNRLITVLERKKKGAE